MTSQVSEISGIEDRCLCDPQGHRTRALSSLIVTLSYLLGSPQAWQVVGNQEADEGTQ
jgi:hypothetical protein